jgi:hypothetical protein
MSLTRAAGLPFLLLAMIVRPLFAAPDVAARFVDEAVPIPPTIYCGQSVAVPITVKNTGRVTWNGTAGFALGKGDEDDPLFGSRKVDLRDDATVAPGQHYTFVVQLTAPSEPGDYLTVWQMTREGLWFGDELRSHVYVTCGEPVDTSTLSGKVMVGYQGWFGCPKDGSDRSEWRHWFRAKRHAAPAKVTIDLWPDVAELAPDQLCYKTGFQFRPGVEAPLYSTFYPETVDTHFRWMREYGIDGAFQQWFTSKLGDESEFAFRSQVTRNVMAAAEKHGRGFAILLDISGQSQDTLVEDTKRLWRHLVDEVKVTQSPAYMRHEGRPVLAIRNLGKPSRPGTPEQYLELIDYFKRSAPRRLRATLVGGLPAYWRTLGADSKADPRWAEVYRSFDVIHGWPVGRFEDDRTADAFSANVTTGDLAETAKLGIDYMAVVWPGFSNHNLTRVATERQRRPLNSIPRRGGQFFWRQIFNALSLDVDMLYIAMFDEVDEGTAIFKTMSRGRDLPRQGRFVHLSGKGVPVPNDWYLRLAGEAKRAMRSRELLSESMPILP